MTNRDEKQASQKVLQSLELGSKEGGVLNKRRHFVKGVALGLPAILTLPRGVAAEDLATSARCDQKPHEKPDDFNPNLHGGTWLTQSVQVCSWTTTKSGGQSITISAYQDIKGEYRQYDSSPGSTVNGTLVTDTYPNFPSKNPPDFPNDWAKDSCASVDALAYYDSFGNCQWYGPGNPSTTWIELSKSCCKSLYPGQACTDNQC